MYEATKVFTNEVKAPENTTLIPWDDLLPHLLGMSSKDPDNQEVLSTSFNQRGLLVTLGKK